MAMAAVCGVHTSAADTVSCITSVIVCSCSERPTFAWGARGVVWAQALHECHIAYTYTYTYTVAGL
jgi:hypothetical protein